MKLIEHRVHHITVSYSLVFDYQGERGWGFTFPCDEHGNVDVAALKPPARENYEACLTGSVNGQPVEPPRVEPHADVWTDPAIGRCECGAEVLLDGVTSSCRCGRDYNAAGHLLTPRSPWGEETGETVTDILDIR